MGGDNLNVLERGGKLKGQGRESHWTTHRETNDQVSEDGNVRGSTGRAGGLGGAVPRESTSIGVWGRI